jgi:two-component system alkaline phosphatase synthesis response regulator PhoP
MKYQRFMNPIKKTILLIDDEEHILRLLQFVLQSIDAHLRVSKTGKEALAFLEQNSASVVLLDYSLPGMNGLETLQHIRKLKSGGDIKVIMLTARDQTIIRAEADGLNVEAFLTKPFSPSELARRVQALMECSS